MVMMVRILLVLFVVSLAGCATPKQWSAIGGSRADGTVRLAFEYGAFEKPQFEQGQGVQLATERCRAWGYTGSEAFGGARQQCTTRNQYGCVAWRVFADFQCTGR